MAALVSLCRISEGRLGDSVRPVDQTVFGYPDGNCFAACVASLLEIGIDDVPDLGHCDGDWTRPLNRWLAERGQGYIEFDTAEKTPYYRLPRKLYAILGGQSPRHIEDSDGELVGHCVVGIVDDAWGFKVVHDPHPSRDGIEGRVESVAFILQLDPRG